MILKQIKYFFIEFLNHNSNKVNFNKKFEII